MRSGIIAAAFAATVLAVPMEKRAVVVDTATDVVYETAYVTVTNGAAPAATPTASGGNSWNGHWGHKPHWWGGSGNKGHKTKTKTTVVAPTPTHTATWEPAPTTTQAQPTTAQPTQSSAPASGYQGMVINQHNAHRANHSAPNIVWDDTLAANAAKVAASCVYAHNTEIGGIPQGQNIAAGVDASQIDRIITNMFYDNEVNWYNGLYGEAQPDMSNFEHWGHFSQIVWKGTEKVGCATQQCSTLQNVGSDVPPVFTVCNYGPPGNFANEYGDNVGQPLGHANIVIS